MTYGDPEYPFFNDLDPVVNIVSAQGTESILKIYVALSKWLYLHGAYLVRAPYSFSVTVVFIYQQETLDNAKTILIFIVIELT